jgi:ArsR family transcriptional regulator
MIAKYKERAKVFKALAHPTRLSIIDELSKGERCVCELIGLGDSDQSTISKHLSLLKAAQILESERRGTQVIYRLKMNCVSKFSSCIDISLVSAAEEKIKELS